MIKKKTVNGQQPFYTSREHNSVLNFWLVYITQRRQEKKFSKMLTLRSAVSEERYQKRYIINVL